tara:strand:+ start:186 stop:380 length:195 start_codon:yes stop_codon:yes gene_type:complete
MKRVAIITFVVFTIEAIIHYNIGAKSENPEHHLGIPKGKNLTNLMVWVLVFAVINAQIIKGKAV